MEKNCERPGDTRHNFFAGIIGKVRAKFGLQTRDIKGGWRWVANDSTMVSNTAVIKCLVWSPHPRPLSTVKDSIGTRLKLRT
jgi:hypothetical protein